MPTRSPIMFHASQALFLLMDNISVKARWLQLFLGERNNINSILGNIGSTYTTDPSSNTNPPKC